MHGLGDNLHQRAVVRELMKSYEVWLETSWVAPYHDLIERGLKVTRKVTPLRTQTKNAAREGSRFSPERMPRLHGQRTIGYRGETVRAHGGVLAAMMAGLSLDVAQGDFRMPVPPQWLARADALIAQWGAAKPLLIYRPLVLRREWFHTERNPDFDAYAQVFAAIRDRFFVVSIADLVPDVEWIVGAPIKADVEFHEGQLDFETIAALMKRAALVYCSPGFAVILAQAVSTPVACMFGGFENSSSFSAGAKYTPYLGLDPIRPCHCFAHNHACDKTLDVALAIARIGAFIDATARDRQVGGAPAGVLDAASPVHA